MYIMPTWRKWTNAEEEGLSATRLIQLSRVDVSIQFCVDTIYIGWLELAST